MQQIIRLTILVLVGLVSVSMPGFTKNVKGDGLKSTLDPSSKATEAQFQFIQGKKYFYGEGVSQDNKKAFLLFSIAADQGYAEAEYFIGDMYANGYGVSQNDRKAKKAYKKAFEYFSKLAEQGKMDAQYYLGVMYQKKKGIPRNKEKAFELFAKSAEQGHPKAQSILGAMYLKGVTHEWGLLIWGLLIFLISLRVTWGVMRGEGDTDSIGMGICALFGCLFGAAMLYGGIRSVKKGDGIPQDYAKAFSWSKKAAEQNDVKAQQTLGTILHNGFGVPQNNIEALKWFVIACGNSKDTAFKVCAKEKRNIQSDMDTAQIAEAEKLAAEFKSKRSGALP